MPISANFAKSTRPPGDDEEPHHFIPFLGLEKREKTDMLKATKTQHCVCICVCVSVCVGVDIISIYLAKYVYIDRLDSHIL